MSLRRCVNLLYSATTTAAAADVTFAKERRVSNALFMERRAKIITDLREKKNDKSLAGCVDPHMVPLVQLINDNFHCYVTTSSCSGRVSLFHKGQLSAPVETCRAERKRGAFGQGALFQSHDHLNDVEGTLERRLAPTLERFSAWRRQQNEYDKDPLIHETELLQLKFEPMIVHVLCETMDDAARLLQCASESGQMESGVLSCSRGTSEHRKITCCITSPLCMDIPLFVHGRWLLGHADFSASEWSALLTNAITHINTLFDANEARRSRFACEIRNRLMS